MSAEDNSRTSLTVAEQILARFKESGGDGVTPLKLQKLLYYVLGWTLAIEKRLLFKDPVEAQPFGPAFPNVWAKYRNEEAINNAINSSVQIESNPLIDAVFSVYGSQNPNILVARTHREQPWIDNYNEDDPDIFAIIPTEDIEKYFTEQLASSDVRMHGAFLNAYSDRKYEVVSVRVPAISSEELEIVRGEVGLA